MKTNSFRLAIYLTFSLEIQRMLKKESSKSSKTAFRRGVADSWETRTQRLILGKSPSRMRDYPARNGVRARAKRISAKQVTKRLATANIIIAGIRRNMLLG